VARDGSTILVLADARFQIRALGVEVVLEARKSGPGADPERFHHERRALSAAGCRRCARGKRGPHRVASALVAAPAQVLERPLLHARTCDLVAFLAASAAHSIR